MELKFELILFVFRWLPGKSIGQTQTWIWAQLERFVFDISTVPRAYAFRSRLKVQGCKWGEIRRGKG